MNARRERDLDPRAWIAWASAASLPALLGRNPFPLVTVLVVVIAVRTAWAGRAAAIRGWSGIVRLALVFAVIGVLFNVLTVRSGDVVVMRVPEAVPVLDGPVTANALVFGVLSGLALLILVLVGTTTAALLDWPATLRLLPERLTTVAVAGSVALAFVPRTAIAFREIREAQAARGHRLRGARDLVPLLVPLLTGGLERAVTLSEALESRGFGAPRTNHINRQRGYSLGVAVGLSAAVLAIYLLAVGHAIAGLLAAGVSGGLLAMAAGRGPAGAVRRTRYRSPSWDWGETAIVAGAGLAALATLIAMTTDPAALRYEPYPDLIPPRVNLLLLACQAALLLPAFLVDTVSAGHLSLDVDRPIAGMERS